MPLTDHQIVDALNDVFAYAEARGYSGYSKYDALNSRLLEILSLNNHWLRFSATQIVTRSPVNLRPMLGVRQSINPKGMAVFALAYLRAAEVLVDERYLSQAQHCLDWLRDHPAESYPGWSWGYDFPWSSLHFEVPRYTPNLVVTGNAAIAFLQSYKQTGSEEALGIARGTVDFIRQGLRLLHDQGGTRAYSYVPGNHWIVVNVQGLASYVMAQIAAYTGEQELREEAAALNAFLMARQTDYGGWHYAFPQGSSPVTHDNYHTGNILDWVLLYGKLTEQDPDYWTKFRLGLDFYRDHLFLDDRAPKLMHNRTYPFNIHGAAQGIITFARSAVHFDEAYLPIAQRITTWTLEHLQAPDGHFYYQKGRFWLNKTPLMRWNQAWMACALAHLLWAQQRLAGDKAAS